MSKKWAADRPLTEDNLSLPLIKAETQTLDDLDRLDARDRLRDEVCKRLTKAAQVALMARYGLPWSV